MFSFGKTSQAVAAPQPNGNIIKSLSSFLARRKQTTGVKQSSWKPSAFHPITLIGAILVAWALIAVLQVLLVHSQQKGGIILAPTTDDIPFGSSFAYLYLPTILALFFSIFWNWIDLQVKRVEPYYQLGRPDGAWGKDSLLISYPFDFLPLVPWSAFKSRHWAVFWASTCVVFVTWGLVPVQSSIFTTETISRTSPTSFLRSESFMPASRQSEDITARYIQSVHGIIWLNETLPPYMTREYILAPIKPRDDTTEKMTNLTWTSNTTLYSLDMKCEIPTIDAKDETRFTGLNSTPTTVRTATYMSSNGCAFPTDYYVSFGNETIGPNESFDNQTTYGTKEFATMYIGYYSTEWANFYLEGLCPETSNHTFMALFTRNKKSVNDPPQHVTRLYCTPFHYQQEVTATVDASTQTPLDIKRMGDKVPLPADKWNSSFFEYQMNTGRNNEQPRGVLPLRYWPDQLESVSALPLSLGAQGTPLNQMAGFSVGATNHSMEELLDPEALRSAYEATYRIIFARSMDFFAAALPPRSSSRG